MLTRFLSPALVAACLATAVPLHAQAQQPSPTYPSVCPASQCPGSDCRLVTKLYPVVELISPPASESTSPRIVSESQLIQLLTHTIAPQSWYGMGGQGSVQFFPQTKALVVHQTPEVQEEVELLLKELTRCQHAQVVVEIRLVDVPESLSWERVGVDFNTPGTQSKPIAKIPTPGTLLNDAQVAQFFELAQAHPETNILQAPKVAVFNGQKAEVGFRSPQTFVTSVEIGQDPSGRLECKQRSETVGVGTQIWVQPIVSADRRFVRLHFRMEDTSVTRNTPIQQVQIPTSGGEESEAPRTVTQILERPSVNTQCLERAVVIPDGGTFVIGQLKKTVEVRGEFGPPILSKIPYVSRLFKNVGMGRENRTVLVLVTPRIANTSQEEVAKPQVAAAPQTENAGTTADCPKNRLTIGVGVNSDAGLTGSITLNERNLDLSQLLMAAHRALMAPPVVNSVPPSQGATHALPTTPAPCPQAVQTTPVLIGQVTPPVPCQQLVQVPQVFRGRIEEQDTSCAKGACCAKGCDPVTQAKDRAVAELVKAYEAACAAGRTDEAEKLAKAALSVDPACFCKNPK